MVRLLLIVVCCLGLLVSAEPVVPPTPLSPGTAEPVPTTGVTTWAAPQMPAQPNQREELGFANVTLRTMVRISAGGSGVRVRLDNTYGDRPLRIGAASVALADGFDGSSLPGTVRPLLLDGRSDFTVPPGHHRYTDPAGLDVPDRARLHVSIFLPGPTGPLGNHPISGEPTLLARGDHTENPTSDRFRPVEHRAVVDAVLVLGSEASGTVVAVGGSLTDGLGVDFPESGRWPDVLADRLLSLPPGRRLAVANSGLSGNRILLGSVGGGPRLLDRYDTDVLSLPGAAAVILAVGTNDIQQTPHETDARTLFAAIDDLARRSRDAGLRVVVATIPPFGSWETWKPELETTRTRVNALIRTHADEYDAVFDLDTLLRDPDDPELVRPDLDLGDGLHLNQRGYTLVGESVPVEALLPR
ncbi:GDSL-type esterase/lipase family protein [Actinoalloteichus caeruleus]|uniref:GDSL-type esterase/lipase family protein n=1 Tax=Actinoalloteichus cyanogriseus TaxID=2893586 RepID=UPI00068B4123|nr:GDSL-type esterase/lipase family protein [Actinoalloteichus caeruleus]